MENPVVRNDGRNEFTITWFIENYSYCLPNNGENLRSTDFTPDGFEGTTWHLLLYPRGNGKKSKSNLCLFLRRDKADDGPELMPLKYELSILALDGSALISRELEYTFKKGVSYGMQQFVQMDEVLLRRKIDFLPEDTLSVRCKMWKGVGNAKSFVEMNAVTRIGIEHMSYLHVVEGFSALKPNEKNTIQIASPSNGVSLTSSLYISNNSCCKENIIVEITPDHYDVDILCKCKFSLLDKSGKVIVCGKADNRFKDTREDIKKLQLSLSKTIILERKSEYLADDKLSLLCDYTFNTGLEEKILRTLYELPLVAIHHLNNNNQKEDTFNAEEKLSMCSSALDDLKAIYDDPLLADVKLETKTKSFPAHKILLCARSSVFKAMLTNDMKESYARCIRIDDLENDTVHQLLLFLYSDNLENLQWESVIKLYYAGDKYAIQKLKVLCSSFLVSNISTSTASEILLLADTHNDSDLRKFVDNFILEHEDDVYSSDEWERLMEVNPQLAMKTMHLKYKRKKKVNNVILKNDVQFKEV